ncbi:MAG: DUF397 domain-containing protein [Pseudonocardia sp.]
MPTTPPAWRKSSFSGHQSNCVEVTALDDGCVAVRNSKRPDQATVVVAPAQMAAWVRGVKAGEFDDLC